ncbi:MAG: hypothetical protein ACQ9MH_12180 [Nitrospinales bacterium]
MSVSHWSKIDFETASIWIAGNEDKAKNSILLKIDDEVTAILPGGLAAFSTGFHGCLMFAPLPLFMSIVALVPIIGFSSSWPLNGTTLILSAGCLGIIFALLFVTRLLLKSRDLFPRTHFVTIGNKGIAMHFSRLNYPYGDPKSSIEWKDIKSIDRKPMPLSTINEFLPKSAMEIISKNGDKVAILLNFHQDRVKLALDEIEQLINERRSL